MAKKADPPWRITSTAIAELARKIAERFDPDRIVLFGSHAYGRPRGDSDVDLLVVMQAKNMVNQAAKIRLALDYDFPLDLIVRTPEYLHERLQMDDWFVHEILSRGKVLYEKGHPRMAAYQNRFKFLSQFAVDYRYPGMHASVRQARAALRWAASIRAETRRLLGLRPRQP